MRWSREDVDALCGQLAAEMAEIVGASAERFEPDMGKATPEKKKLWEPRLGPTQQKMFRDGSDIVGACGEKYTGKCCSPDTLVWSPDGIVRLGTLAPAGDFTGFRPATGRVWGFDGTALAEARIAAFYRDPSRDARRVVFSNGKVLTCSPRHPLWVCSRREHEKTQFGWMTVGEIERATSEGRKVFTPMFRSPDYVVPPQRVILRDGTSVEITESVAYMLGALCGDGSCNGIRDTSRGIYFTNQDPECVVNVSAAVKELGGTMVHSTNANNCEYRINGSWTVRWLLIALGLDCLAYGKSIPDQIWRSDRKILRQYVRGLFDTDGTVDKIGVVSFTTTSERLADDVLNALQVFGIIGAKRFRKSASGRPTWNVTACGRHARRFGKEIGFAITRKQKRIREAKSSVRLPDGTHNGYGYPSFICGDLLAAKHRYLEDHHHKRAWHRQHKGTLNPNHAIPGPEKLRRLLSLLRCEAEFSAYLVSDNWVSVAEINPVESELVDLSVDALHSFVANGIISHNSIGFLDKIVAHCHSERDALYTIIGNAHRALAEGVCHDLVTFTLPRWRDGNREPPFIYDGNGNLLKNPKEGDLIDNGIGLEFTPWKSDPNNKDLYLKIRNRFGGWSRIRVIAIPYADMVQARVTNLNASGVYLEEATRTNGKEYYTWPALQLYRRRGIVGPQQFTFSCNPDDPDKEDRDETKWVWKWMYRESKVGKNDPGRDWPNDPEEPGIRRDPQVAFYYLHYKENEANVSQKNREILHRTLRTDPVMRQRLLESKWVATPAGDAMFKREFSEARHIKGDLEKKRGVTPVPGHPIVISMDWGSRNLGLVFRQFIETEDGPFKVTFDSLSFYQEMHRAEHLARAILEKMRYWNLWLRDKRGWSEETAKRDEQGRIMDRPSWCFWFITGDDATTNWNPESGSIHARDLQDHMQKIVEADPVWYAGIEAPHIRGCPRPKESVEKRVDIVAEDLESDMTVVSALCQDVKGMFFHLPRDKENPAKPAKGNRWIHIFDAYSYADYYRRFVLPGGFTNFKDGPMFEVS